MRISDWSSDVCSSDLRPRFVVPFASFVYFSHAENSYVNADINLPGTAAEHIAEHTDAVPVLLKHTEHWHGHVPKDNAPAIAWWPGRTKGGEGQDVSVRLTSRDGVIL